MFDLSTAPFELVTRIYGEPGNLDAGILPFIIGNVFWTCCSARPRSGGATAASR